MSGSANSGIIPFLTVQNLDAAIEFYQQAFGFELVDKYTKNTDGHQHGVMRFNDVILMFRPEGGNSASKAPATLNIEASTWLILYCDDVDAQFAKATAAGATVFVEPHDAEWGERWCKVIDPNGHAWSFSKRLSCK